MAYSHSSLSTFETCPKQYEHIYIIKDVARGDTEATIWGKQVHKAVEDYAILGTPPTLEICDYAVGIVEECRKIGGDGRYGQIVEWQFGMDDNFVHVGFDSPDAYIRGVIDFGCYAGDKAILIDWKTSKNIKPDFDQMSVFVLAMFQCEPGVERIKAAYAWLKHKQMTQRVYDRRNLEELKESVRERVERVDAMVQADNFPMKPSGLCRGWCAVKSCAAWKPMKE